MNTATALLVAITFVWTGLILGISFIEAPLKFRAPGVTIPIGLGIGRLVFRVVNGLEALFALVLVLVLVLEPLPRTVLVALGIAVTALVLQLVFVRPGLNRRSNAVLAGQDVPRSRAHHVYVVAEVAKFAALLTGGIALLASL